MQGARGMSSWCSQQGALRHWVEMQRGAIGQKFENWLASQYLHEKHYEVKNKEEN